MRRTVRSAAKVGSLGIVALFVIGAVANYLPAGVAPSVALDLANLPQTLLLEYPDRVSPGAGLAVAVHVPGASERHSVSLDVEMAMATARLHSTVRDGVARFDIAGDLVSDAGIVTLVAATKDAVGVGRLEVLPGRAVDGIRPLAGPRSIVADRKHWTMVSVLAGERLGNGLPDDTSVVLHVRRADGTETSFRGTMKGLLSGIRVFSGTVAGLTTIRVDVDGATGPEVQIREVAGPPVEFSVELPQGTFIADARSLIEMRTPQLRDQYDNILEDGTEVVLEAVGPDGPMRLLGQTIDGRCVIRVRAPSRPGVIVGTIAVMGSKSKPFSLRIEADAESFPVRVTRVDSNVQVAVGPVRSTLGGFASDGTLVTVSSGTDVPRSGQLRDGTAIVLVPAARGESISVKVLGRSIEVIAP